MSMSYLTFAFGFAIGFIVALCCLAAAVVHSERDDESRGES